MLRKLKWGKWGWDRERGRAHKSALLSWPPRASADSGSRGTFLKEAVRSWGLFIQKEEEKIIYLPTPISCWSKVHPMECPTLLHFWGQNFRRGGGAVGLCWNETSSKDLEDRCGWEELKGGAFKSIWYSCNWKRVRTFAKIKVETTGLDNSKGLLQLKSSLVLFIKMAAQSWDHLPFWCAGTVSPESCKQYPWKCVPLSSQELVPTLLNLPPPRISVQCET